MNEINFITIIIAFYLRKPLGLEKTPNRWRSLFTSIMAAAVALIVIDVVSEGFNLLLMVSTFALIGTLIFMVFKYSEFHFRKNLIFALLPLIGTKAISHLAELINHTWYIRWVTYFETAEFFAFIWAIAMWILNRRQAKALEKEQQKAIIKEREYQIAAKVKDELEIQVAERTKEITKQKEELEAALEVLRSTQDQLIQSEKMASLGELTAGIAHEIQNPLNFVNNFSEVSNELIQEIKEELSKAPAERDQELIAEIFSDVADNLSKIAYHGKRADTIVKGMLQHSRTSSGVKELTDINELADEYLRLAYHGLRAKDKTFNADFQTDFDDLLPKVEVISQDFGRVLLNLVNNAFYAVNEKKLKLKSDNSAEEYKPFVKITTRRNRNKIQIKVEDNGMGMPESVKQKIFQPFFTTKPTGQGTGLGMSLSYDIVKSHGGDIQVQSEDGKGTQILIELPT
ncbi:sensor histidine kinase [Algoriphagus marinus]|uniref:sensor histidine kinase n=1 Tax=Algoriphagus marinus TaxID=1925762 RepID=UPI00094BAFB0|nr:ATP-binding protein [Algoriphagus marinus]